MKKLVLATAKYLPALTFIVALMFSFASGIEAVNEFQAGDIENKALPSPRGRKEQSGTDLAYYISVFWDTALIVASLAFLVYLLVGAFRYLTAGGDQKATLEARNIIMHAFVGLMIVASSFVIIKIVESITGVTIVGGPIKFPTPAP
ncbi:MAG: hypothetical protein A3F33_02365 [Candidatus Woykebacteria bacterium RIFCSPHIGHO2_12_FULL_43_10]|uniref:Uncharacterized protein n=2 Tax=Candidatus Woykeibacteriota TaxID=1817899 RepID=A0A1G1WTN2_9BACT|nr:MAG: hypothetical protein A2802_00900 [Candidatus Woykebacteria bacterium RIFCSPHIGHO2_01_FULL_43_29]OGY28472.1 MAG: hypothetical protein A3J50_00415 [Candidatus Woykebacteria bacterium RIFCSPHIGHO2_02_FULL_43_16b]OGY28817.1 MAG: hypothetical protein A3F33_02365 [Candidatus Woykebacteria bacterium RIFCSPHIGHO2_12_FULL_43_10]OGY31092.1 MAG: hypothetical protein A3A61_04005 [Candidatus Woykebacteria bacterium RIFCSPLOWO2_01_FULL_43_14]